jgi:hypothetical protein
VRNFVFYDAGKFEDDVLIVQSLWLYKEGDLRSAPHQLQRVRGNADGEAA